MAKIRQTTIYPWTAMTAATMILLMVLFLCGEASSQVERWGSSTGMAYYGPVAAPRAKKLRTYEVHGSLAIQEGVVLAPSPSRSPMSLRAMVGVNVFKFHIAALGGRILNGPFFSFPFSIEIGYLEDIKQFGPALGWQFSARPSPHWKWLAGIQISLITPDVNAVGPGIYLGAVYYFLAGFGIFGEANLDVYFASARNSLTAGGTVGVAITYEFFRAKERSQEIE